MFQITCYGWLLFRADSFHQIVSMTRALAHPFDAIDGSLALKVLGFASPLILVQIVQYVRGKLDFLDFAWMPIEGRAVLYTLATYCVLFLGGQPASFIYFQF
jgi:hypothetical protein